MQRRSVRVKKLLGGVLFLWFIGSLASCASPAGERYRPSGVNSAFTFPGGSFEEYIVSTKHMIEKGRTDITPENRQVVVEGNAPFSLVPPTRCPPGNRHPFRQGILLVHGLTDSPYTMRSLARFFRDACFMVEAPLLPGHGTRPGDLLEVSWREWERAYRFAVKTLKEKVDKAYLGGFSTGATLSIHHAMGDGDIRGLFLFSPAVRLTKMAKVACWLDALGGLFPGLKWIGKPKPDDNYFKYQSFTANAACQIFHLTKDIEEALGNSPIGIPLFVAASADDSTVELEGTLRLYKQATTAHKKMLLYARQAKAAWGLPASVTVVDSRIPDFHIVSSSHLAIVFPPDDPFFGTDGKFSYCHHYYGNNAAAYARCRRKQEDFLGETQREFMQRGVVRRLTYNPHYEGMLKTMRAFLKAMPEG